MQIRFKHILSLVFCSLFSLMLFGQTSHQVDTITPEEQTQPEPINPEVEKTGFDNLSKEEQAQLLDYIRTRGVTDETIIKLTYDQLSPEEKRKVDLYSDFIQMSRDEIPVTKVEYISKHIEFGDFVLGEAKIEVIRFKNVGDQPYIITGTSPSCPCIEADYANVVVMPGEEGEVRITLSSAGYEPVPFDANISIRDNSYPDRRNIIRTNGIIKKSK